MKLRFLFVSFFVLLALISCENRVALSSKANRFIASEHLKKIDGNENLPNGIKELLHQEQSFYNRDLLNSDAAFVPGNNPKFPLPYYLISEEDVKFFFSKSLDPRVADQLSMKISGMKHYKLFIHPKAEAFYDFLRASYNYVGPDKTEFMASPTSSNRSLVVWNKNNSERKAFIAKISFGSNLSKNLNQSLNANDVERSIANQRLFDQLGENKLNQMNVKLFPESAGLVTIKIHPRSPKAIGAQLIREIPDEIVEENKKWISFSTALGSNQKIRPMILDIIAKTGLSSYQFFEHYMMDNYLKMYEDLSLKSGVNFVPQLHSLLLETSKDLKPTGKWVIREFDEVWPDVITIGKNGGPVDVYMEEAGAAKFKLRVGRVKSIEGFIAFKQNVFNVMLSKVAEYDPDLTSEKVQSLKNTIDARYMKLINGYFRMNLKEIPNMSDYQRKVETTFLEQIQFDEQIERKEIKESENLKTFLLDKKEHMEWVELFPKKEKSEFSLTNHALYEVSNKMIAGFAFFNKDELDDYNSNGEMLSIFKQTPPLAPKTGCFADISPFFSGTK